MTAKINDTPLQIAWRDARLALARRDISTKQKELVASFMGRWTRRGLRDREPEIVHGIAWQRPRAARRTHGAESGTCTDLTIAAETARL